MRLPEICIRHPVFSIVLSLILIVLGIVAYQDLEIRFFPELRLPMVTVNTSYPGASAQLMESEVTARLEDAIAGVDGVQTISSTSRRGRSYISVLFNLGGDLEQEASSLRDKVAGVRDKLPSDINPPTISVGVTGNSLIGIGIIDKTKTSAQVRNYVERYIQPLIRQQPGVGRVGIEGSSSFAMRVWLNAAKMVSYNITVADVKNALLSNNIYFPAGAIINAQRSYSLVSKTQLTTPFQFSQIIVKQAAGRVLRLKDIATVGLNTRSLDSAPVRINGENGIELVVSPLQTANPIAMAQAVRDEVVKLQSKLPDGMTMNINYDASVFLKNSIDETAMTVIISIILVILVVFLFLGSVRAAMIPIVTIPVSLIGVLFIILLLGFTINMMSLLGMVLAIGLVVDDAVVMLENIHRHIEMGKTPFAAAVEGSREITFAVIAMTITLVAVYAPLGVIQGVTSELFKEFAFTLAASVLISGYIALTLSPMMCSKILTAHSMNTGMARRVDLVFTHLTGWYERQLMRCLRGRLWVVIALLVVAGVGCVLFMLLNSEMMPKEDQGLVQVSVTSPTGSSLQYTSSYMHDVVDLVKENPSVAGVISEHGSSWGRVTLPLKKWGIRNKSTEQIIAELNPKLAMIPGVTAVAYVPDIVNYGMKGDDVTLNIMTSQDYRFLIAPINQVMYALKSYPGLINVHTNLKYDAQQFAVRINRNLAGVLGVNLQDVADTMSAMMSGVHWSDVAAGEKSYPVIVQMERKDLEDLSALSKLYVHALSPIQLTDNDPNLVSSTAKDLVPLSSLVTVTPQVGQGSFTHFNRFRSGSIGGRLAPGVSEGEAIKHVNAIVDRVLGSNVRYAYSGKAAQFLKSSGSIVGIFALSFVFIYLVLAAQFGSFLDPLIILLAVPLSLVGALFALWATGGTLSIYSEIGLVTLVGLVSKHGILITQFANDLRLTGMPLQSALMQAASTRLRPILMTTMAMVVGALPLALATGPGSIGRNQIGWVIVAGLLFGTFFSLVVVPVAYSYFGAYKRLPGSGEDQ